MAADGILDIAGLETAAAAATPVDGGAEDTLDTTVDSTITEGDDKVNADGTPKTEDGAAKTNPDGTPKVDDADELPKNTPENIRKALKTFRDADPKNAGYVKALHGAYERWEATKEIFPKGVNEMREAKQFIELVGGPEGFEGLQSKVADIQATDELLSAGDPKLIENIVEDLKGAGKIDSLGKLTGPWLDAVKKNDEAGFYKAFEPHFIAGLEEVKIPEVVASILGATTLEAGKEKDPDALLAALAKVKNVAGNFDKWIKSHQEKLKASKADDLSPERVKFNQEREQFKKQQEEFKTNQSKEFQNAVAQENDKSNNNALGSALADYVKLPFFKSFKDASWKDLAGGLRTNLFASLKSDKAYQTQMKAMWGSKTPDRGKILEYHKSKVNSIAKDIVRRTIETRYPGYAKGGAAAGRVAAAAAKKDADTKTDAAAAATGKPVYVATKPAWEAIDWTKDPKQYLYTAGKAYLKTGGKLVTWRKA
jgi:hypothetical protein